MELYLLLSICLFSTSARIVASQWTGDFYKNPEVEPGVEFSGTANAPVILMNENIEPPITICFMNYKGDKEPNITNFLVGNNVQLGLKFQQDSAGQDWKLVVELEQDYENPIKRYSFRVTVDNTIESNVIITLRDLNDNPPEYASGSITCKIPENTLSYTPVCTFDIEDKDEISIVDGLTHSIIGDNGVQDKFNLKIVQLSTINKATVTIEVKQELDYEAIILYQFEIKFTDKAGNEGVMSYTVEVQDVSDEPPQWTEMQTIITIDEEIEDSTTYRIKAIDGDKTINWPIRYKIDPPNNFVDIDGTTGQLTIHKIDRDVEGHDTVDFIVVAYEDPDPVEFPDAEIKTTEADIKIYVNDIDDNLPMIEIGPIDPLPENSSVTVTKSIKIVDLDLGGNAMYTLELKSDPGTNYADAFMLVPDSGYKETVVSLIVQDQNMLDYEKPEWQNFKLTIVSKGTADESMTDEKVIDIQLKDWNDESPIFGPELLPTLEVNETVGIGYELMTVTATDADNKGQDEVKFSLVGSSVLRLFEIDPVTGILKTKTDRSFDFQREEIVEIQIKATDSWTEGKALHSEIFILTVNVLDQNDKPPVLTLPQNTVSINENSADKTLILDGILISDPDSDATLELKINWEKTKATKNGIPVVTDKIENIINVEKSVGDNEYKLTLNEMHAGDTPDFELYDALQVVVELTDLDTLPEYPNSRTVSGTLIVTINDINDNSPVFDPSASEPKRVIEGSSNLFIGTIYATDADTLPEFKEINFSLEPIGDTPEGLIEIGEKNGELTAVGDIDAEPDVSELKYTVKAVNLDGNRETNATITVQVIDKNDNRPELCNGPIDTIRIEEKPSLNTVIKQIKGCDADKDDPQNKIGYYLDTKENPALGTYFLMNETSGEITANYPVDPNLLWHTLKDGITINFIMIDMLGSTTETGFSIPDKFQLELIDVNDHDPELPDVSIFSNIVDESVTSGQTLGTITATDLDNPEQDGNGLVTITIKSVIKDDEPLTDEIFKVVPDDALLNTVKIETAANLRGYHGTYKITLEAVDGGGNTKEKVYDAKIEKYNFEIPTFIYPLDGQPPVRIIMGQDINTELMQITDVPLPLINATDNQEEKYIITYTILPPHNGAFTIRNNVSPPQKGRLMKIDPDLDETVSYKIQIEAKHDGLPEPNTNTVDMEIRFLNKTAEPFFVINDWQIDIDENSAGGTKQCFEKAIYDEDSEGELFPIFYFLHADTLANYSEFFEIKNSDENCLYTKVPIDAEAYEEFDLKIYATKSEAGNLYPSTDSTLLSKIIINDLNDNAPIFAEELYTAGISSSDEPGKKLITVEATDADKTSQLEYSFVPGSMLTYGNGLDSLPDSAFTVEKNTGVVLLSFTVKNSMEGYISFKVQVSDGIEDHIRTTLINVYIITDSKHRITFTFLNNITVVEEKESEAKSIFTEVIEYTCNIDLIKKVEDDNGMEVEAETDVITHFVDSKTHSPIDREKILTMGNDLEFRTKLQRQLSEVGLTLKGFDTLTSVAENMEEILTIALIVTAVVLSTFIVVLIIAFIIRTRTLQKRLDKLSFTQYGSQDSGLNRIGVPAPNTNKHAVQGSNPVYSSDDIKKTPLDDTASIGSGDSELVGVEDNPEFDFPERRASINPVMHEHELNKHMNY